MRKTERMREAASEISLDLLAERARDGWKLSGLEWTREVEAEAPEPQPALESPPYGLRVASDCRGLEQDPDEQKVILTIFGMIVQDTGCAEIARTLNERGFRTRRREQWTALDVFQLMPRLIEAGQKTFATERWATIRKGLFKSA
jgi:hypothetical protein